MANEKKGKYDEEPMRTQIDKKQAKCQKRGKKGCNRGVIGFRFAVD